MQHSSLPNRPVHSLSTAVLEPLERRRLLNATLIEQTPAVIAHAATTGTQATVDLDYRDSFGVIVWSDTNVSGGSGADIVARRIGPDGQFVGSPVLVNSSTSGSQTHPSVAVASDGSFLVAWLDDGVVPGRIRARWMAADATPAGAEFTVNSDNSTAKNEPTVAVAGDRTAVIVWVSTGGQDGSADGIYGQRYDASGAAVGAEFLINTTTAGNQNAPDVAMADDHRFIVTWHDWNATDGDGVGVFAQRYDTNGNPQGAEQLVNTTTTADQGSPTIDITPDASQYVIAWDSSASGGDFEIFFQRYDGSGAAQGGETRANLPGSGDLHYPRISLNDDDGSFLLAWKNVTDGVNQGRFFSPTGTPLSAQSLDVVGVNNVVSNAPAVAMVAGTRLAAATIINNGADDDAVLATWINALVFDGTAGNDVMRVSSATPQQITTTLGGADTNWPAIFGAVRVNGMSGRDAITLSSLPPNAFDIAIDGGDGNDTVSGSPAGERISGGAGIDLISYADRSQALSISTDGQANDGAAGENDDIDDTFERFVLGNGDDSVDLQTLDHSATVFAGAGNDSIFGSLRRDTLLGGDGNDTLLGWFGADVIYGQAGNDKIWGQRGRDQIRGGHGIDRIKGDHNDDTIFAEAGDDRLYGDHGDDQLDGGDGRDAIIGDVGDDLLIGSTAGDRLFAQAGNDTLDGGAGSDRMDGGEGIDTCLNYDTDPTGDRDKLLSIEVLP
ncbi:calcium-binding protein [Fontivita pretiosa]|uniref:calcium-binding protein n=1 Tax=Fontivita pretiosa TaxID=2989684 RepID=UPI003D17003B